MQTGFSSLGRAISLGKGKTLDSKSKKCCSGKSVAHSCTILLSAYPKNVPGSTQAFITINKSPIRLWARVLKRA